MVHFRKDLVELERLKRTSVDGKRMYETPTGLYYPSVTTVTSQLNKESIKRWRSKVGEETANKISTQASRRGTAVHKLCEDYVLGNLTELNGELSEEKVMPSNRHVFHSIRNILDEHVNNIRAVEGFLYSDFLRTAGQVDLIAEFDGQLAIIDFKTSKKLKKEEWIENYFIQESAYSFMFEERTDIKVPLLVTIIGVDNEQNAQVFIKGPKQRNEYLLKFLDLRQKWDQSS